jgi:hypothetical protein
MFLRNHVIRQRAYKVKDRRYGDGRRIRNVPTGAMTVTLSDILRCPRRSPSSRMALCLGACIKQFQSRDARINAKKSFSQSHPGRENCTTHHPLRSGNVAPSIGRIMLDQFFAEFIAVSARDNTKTVATPTPSHRLSRAFPLNPQQKQSGVSRAGFPTNSGTAQT